MAEVQIDHGINGAKASEEGGIVNGFTRVAFVTDIRDDGEPYGSAITVFKVYEALDDAGFAYGDILEFEGEQHPNLTVSRRAVEMADIDKAVVVLTYSFLGLGGGQQDQDLDDPEHGGIFYRHRASVEQVSTNKYPSWHEGDGNDADLDLASTPISLDHTFPDGSGTYVDAHGDALDADKDFPGQTFHQGGEISMLVVRRYITVDGIKGSTTPADAVALMGKLNSETWMSGASPAGGNNRTWLCTAYDYEIADPAAGAQKYRVHIEFEFREEGWDPTAVFLDKRTGKPPVGLVEDEGYRTIAYLPEVAFTDYVDITEG